jgi:hypothetical protein
MAALKKVIVSNQSALQAKYHGDVNLITGALSNLIASDQNRGTATEVIFLDDAASMSMIGTPVTDHTSAHQNKDAVTAVLIKKNPDHLLLLGSTDVIPHQDLDNPAHNVPGKPWDDQDKTVPSDLPYASTAPFSLTVADFLAPSFSVGRLPDVSGGADASYLVSLLNTAAAYTGRSAAAYTAAYLALCTTESQSWEDRLLNRVFGSTGAEKVVSTANHSPWQSADLAKLPHIVDCHGFPFSPCFYGLFGETALCARELDAKAFAHVVVAVGCCYSAELYDPDPVHHDPATIRKNLSVCNTYLGNQAYGYLGSSTLTFAENDSIGKGDFLCSFFLSYVFHGFSLGQALLKARHDYLSAYGMSLDQRDQKTIAQFNLMGDPALQPVGP